MIRINLLEVREERRKIAIRNLLITAGVVWLTTFLAVFLWHRGLANDIAQVKQDIVQKKQEIKELKDIVGQVDEIREQKKDLEKKLEIIQSLEANRAEIVDFLLAFSETMPEEVWVRELEFKNRNVVAKCTSVDLQSIGLYVKRLKADDRFENARTGNIKADSGEGGFMAFELNVEFVPPQAPGQNEEAG